jgi:uncharacterized C2H2 Zn-finger protein
MTVLTYQDAEGRHREYEFCQEVRIGSDLSRNEVVLPAALGVMREHAVITRSALNHLPVLVDLADGGTRVNDRRAVNVQVLRHGDELQLGQARLTLWEVRISRLKSGAHMVGRECPVCSDSFRAGDEVIACPRCPTVYHRDCWFSISICAYSGCEYPIHETVMDALSTWISFDRQLEEGSSLVESRDKENKLVRKGVSCRAGQRRDQVPFQMGQKVARCPSCETPFHLECWLGMDHCPVCSYNVRDLVNRVFQYG